MKGFKGFIYNVIYISDREIQFKYDIFSIEISSMNKIFIILDIPEENSRDAMENNNLYCYDYDGNFLWQIKSRDFKKYPLYKAVPIQGATYNEKNNRLIVNDFCGGRFEINQEDGSISKILEFSK